MEVYDSTASNALDMYLKDYLWYATQGAAVDDNPIYLFEKLTGDHRLLGDYTVPKYFTSEYDLFTAVSPPLITARWLLLGPPRSGSNIHFDPNHTSAWNTLLLGHKKWVLFPPDTPEASVLDIALGHVAGGTPVNLASQNCISLADVHQPTRVSLAFCPICCKGIKFLMLHHLSGDAQDARAQSRRRRLVCKYISEDCVVQVAFQI